MPGSLQIEKMALEEKLEAIEILWADLCQHESEVPTPDWHKKTLDEREQLVAKGEAKFSDWETAKKRLSERMS